MMKLFNNQILVVLLKFLSFFGFRDSENTACIQIALLAPREDEKPWVLLSLVTSFVSIIVSALDNPLYSYVKVV